MANKLTIYIKIKRTGESSCNLDIHFKTNDNEPEKFLENFDVKFKNTFFKNLDKFEEQINKKDLYGLKPFSEYQIGRMIYNQFFRRKLKTTFNEFFLLLTTGIAEGLTLLITSDDENILNIPFELIADEDFFTFKSGRFNIIRTSVKALQNFFMQNMRAVPLPLKILFVTSLPENIDENLKFTETEKEEIALIEALGDLVSEKKVLIDFLNTASLRNIENTLTKGKHDILHISGHGNKGFLLLENEDHEETIVSSEELSSILKGKKYLKLVVLSACDSSETANELMKTGIPAVVGMGFTIQDKNATKFTSSFYRDLSSGKSLSEAMFNARKVIYEAPDEFKTLSNYFLREWFVSYLYLNQNITSFINLSETREINDYFKSKTDENNLNYPAFGTGFIGKRKEIAELTNIFKKRKAICIYGLGGLGKTTLALNFTRIFQNGSYKTIFLQGEITEKHILESIVKEFNLKRDIIDNHDLTPVEKFTILDKKHIKNKKIIFLFDNFEDNQKYSSEITANSLKILLENMIYHSSDNIKILFTTRYKLNLMKVEYHNIKKMSFPEIYRMMNLSDSLKTLTLKNKKLIYEKTGGHPRVIELISGTISKDLNNTENILSVLEKTENHEKKHDLFFDILWDKLNEKEKLILKYASAFREKTEISMLHSFLSVSLKSIEKTIKRLNRLSLVYIKEDNFFVHRLTASYVLSSKTKEYFKKEINMNIALAYTEILTGTDDYRVEDILNIRWHYIQAGEYYEAFIATYNIHYLSEKGFSDLILDLYLEFERFELSLKEKADLYHQTAMVYDDKAMYDKSLEYYKKALKINKKINFQGGIAINLGQMGVIYDIAGKHNKAINCFKVAFSIAKSLDNFNVMVETLINLGRMYQIKRDIKKMEEYLEAALKHIRNINDILKIVSLYEAQARLYLEKDFSDGAQYYADKALKILENTDKTSNGYASVLILQGEVRFYESKSDILRILNDPDCYEKMKTRSRETLEYYKKALDIYKKNDNLQGVAVAYHYIGIVKSEDLKYRESIYYFKKSLEISETIKYISFSADNYIEIAEVYLKTENYDEFFINILKAYEIYKKLKLENKNYCVVLFLEFLGNLNENELEGIIIKAENKINPNILDEIFEDLDKMMEEMEEEESGS